MTNPPNDRPKATLSLDVLSKLSWTADVPTEQLGVLRATGLRGSQMDDLSLLLQSIDRTDDRAVVRSLMTLTLGYPAPNDAKQIVPLSELDARQLMDGDVSAFASEYATHVPTGRVRTGGIGESADGLPARAVPSGVACSSGVFATAVAVVRRAADTGGEKLDTGRNRPDREGTMSA